MSNAVTMSFINLWRYKREYQCWYIDFDGFLWVLITGSHTKMKMKRFCPVITVNLWKMEMKNIIQMWMLRSFILNILVFICPAQNHILCCKEQQETGRLHSREDIIQFHLTLIFHTQFGACVQDQKGINGCYTEALNGTTFLRSKFRMMSGHIGVSETGHQL